MRRTATVAALITMPSLTRPDGSFKDVASPPAATPPVVPAVLERHRRSSQLLGRGVVEARDVDRIEGAADSSRYPRPNGFTPQRLQNAWTMVLRPNRYSEIASCPSTSRNASAVTTAPEPRLHADRAVASARAPRQVELAFEPHCAAVTSPVGPAAHGASSRASRDRAVAYPVDVPAQPFDVELVHLQHRLHDAAGLHRIRVLQEAPAPSGRSARTPRTCP